MTQEDALCRNTMKDSMLHGMQMVMINQNPTGNLLYLGVLTVGVVRYFGCLSQRRTVILIINIASYFLETVEKYGGC